MLKLFQAWAYTLLFRTGSSTGRRTQWPRFVVLLLPDCPKLTVFSWDTISRNSQNNGVVRYPGVRAHADAMGVKSPRNGNRTRAGPRRWRIYR
ncbi:hypothetical protein BC834DRAFT_316697 [Gloeopeniophorella convolvens]|nr:hypothetical protein BC834DRAFT_316697 [Gloeopeniophorella convolvens]